MKKLAVVFLAGFLLADPVQGLTYFGRFDFESKMLVLRDDWFDAFSMQSTFSNRVSWTGSPAYDVLMLCSSAYPTDFAITPDAKLAGFLGYDAYENHALILKDVGVLTFRPGPAVYGFAARSHQPVTGKFNVDYFKNVRYSANTLPDYVAGRHPKKKKGKLYQKAWRRSGLLAEGTVKFPLVEGSLESYPEQERKAVHSFNIPTEKYSYRKKGKKGKKGQKKTKRGSLTRYIWCKVADLSSNAQSGLYIIPDSQYANFMSGGNFTYLAFSKHRDSVSEIMLPAGTHHVVAINGRNVIQIHAGSGVSRIYCYK